MTRLYSLLICILTLHTLSAQEATTSTSGSGQAGNIILDWSLGEMTLVSTVSNSGLTFTQGLLQGTRIAVPVHNGIRNGELLVFPNPTAGPLTIQIAFWEPGQLSLIMYDASGRLLVQSKETVGSFSTRTMDLSRYAGGIYLLHAVFAPTNGASRKNTYKIFKN